jgi:serine/threonine protein kinase
LVETHTLREISFFAEGGQAITFRALDAENRNVLIKCLKEPSNECRYCPLSDLHLYIREARVSELVKIPGIPRVLKVGRLSDGTVFLIREEIRGHSLLELIDQHGKLPSNQVIKVLKDVAGILAQVHDWRGHRIFHSDIKPSNIILGEDGTTTLIDFGAARTVEVGNTFMQSVTRHGTPGYTPLEQLVGGAVPSSDLYSLGVTAIEALLGYIPEALTESLIDKQSYSLPDDLIAPQGLKIILEKMVRPLKHQRYNDATELLKDIANLESGSCPSKSTTYSEPLARDRAKLLRTLTALWSSGEKAWLGYAETLFLTPCINTFRRPLPPSRRNLMQDFGERICDAFYNPEGGERTLDTDTFVDLLTMILTNSDYFYDKPRLFGKGVRTGRTFAYFWHLYVRGMEEQAAATSSFGHFGWYSDPKSVKSPIQELAELVSLMATRLNSENTASFKTALQKHPQEIFYDRRVSLILLCAILRGERTDCFPSTQKKVARPRA